MALKNVQKLHIKVSLGIELYFNFRLSINKKQSILSSLVCIELLNKTHEIYMGT